MFTMQNIKPTPRKKTSQLTASNVYYRETEGSRIHFCEILRRLSGGEFKNVFGLGEGLGQEMLNWSGRVRFGNGLVLLH